MDRDRLAVNTDEWIVQIKLQLRFLWKIEFSFSTPYLFINISLEVQVIWGRQYESVSPLVFSYPCTKVYRITILTRPPSKVELMLPYHVVIHNESLLVFDQLNAISTNRAGDHLSEESILTTNSNCRTDNQESELCMALRLLSIHKGGVDNRGK